MMNRYGKAFRVMREITVRGKNGKLFEMGDLTDQKIRMRALYSMLSAPVAEIRRHLKMGGSQVDIREIGQFFLKQLELDPLVEPRQNLLSDRPDDLHPAFLYQLA
jgi:hypothetical protein